jgi:hypothetical protein
MVALPPVTPRTVDAIYTAIEADHTEVERGYLGASSIGDPCERKLWYAFRWATPPEKFSGRMLRLFATGHVQEARLVEDLRRAGILVYDRDGEKQIGVTAVGGHFRGHLDGIAERVPEAPKALHVLECKTHSAKSFKELTAMGVAAAKPMHMAQMQVYMHLRDINRALYLAVCKDDEQIYVERVHYDAAMAIALIAKAERIITANSPPPRLHDDIEAKVAWECRYCSMRGVCHDGEMPRTNCRTCLHSEPIMGGDGDWWCARHHRHIDADQQRAGCPNHLHLPGLIPGKQIDASEEEEWVEYRMRDGSIWRDGAAA